jgi:hypothetical protein
VEVRAPAEEEIQAALVVVLTAMVDLVDLQLNLHKQEILEHLDMEMLVELQAEEVLAAVDHIELVVEEEQVEQEHQELRTVLEVLD